MNGLTLFLVSGVILGLWDIFKKLALKDNSVMAVLAAYTSLSFLLVSFEYKEAITVDFLVLLIILVKTIIVFVAWNLTFLALKKLPISMITPFNTLQPICTIILGVLILNESIEFLQWIGIAIMFCAYYLIGKVGTFEVKDLFKNKYFYCMLGGAALNAISALLDKIIIKNTAPELLQFWFLFWMACLCIGTFLIQKWGLKRPVKLNFNKYIVIMSALIVIGDRIYFKALHLPNTPISIAMPLRSISIVVSVIIGGLMFKEAQIKKKLACIGILFVGIILVFVGPTL